MTASQHAPADLKDHEDDVHVVPVYDLRAHEGSRTCWCFPRRDDDFPQVVWFHNEMTTNVLPQ